MLLSSCGGRPFCPTLPFTSLHIWETFLHSELENIGLGSFSFFLDEEICKFELNLKYAIKNNPYNLISKKNLFIPPYIFTILEIVPHLPSSIWKGEDSEVKQGGC